MARGVGTCMYGLNLDAHIPNAPVPIHITGGGLESSSGASSKIILKGYALAT